MQVTRDYVIQGRYGWLGTHNGQAFSVFFAGIATWAPTFDGTAQGLKRAFFDMQSASDEVAQFNAIADTHGFPRSYGQWVLFSVIDSFERQA